MIKSAAALPRSFAIVDAGPLKAAIDRGDACHDWARRILCGTPARFVTCEAAIVEAQHLLKNHLPALQALRRLVGRMDVVPLGDAGLAAAFEEAEARAPQMDFADACIVTLARRYEPSFVLTTDFRDFSSYRVPFACPQGIFHV